VRSFAVYHVEINRVYGIPSLTMFERWV